MLSSRFDVISRNIMNTKAWLARYFCRALFAGDFLHIFQLYVRARNWPCLIVRDDQQSGKDEFSFTELVLPDECSCLTIIMKDQLVSLRTTSQFVSHLTDRISTTGNLVQFSSPVTVCLGNSSHILFMPIYNGYFLICRGGNTSNLI